MRIRRERRAGLGNRQSGRHCHVQEVRGPNAANRSRPSGRRRYCGAPNECQNHRKCPRSHALPQSLEALSTLGAETRIMGRRVPSAMRAAPAARRPPPCLPKYWPECLDRRVCAGKTHETSILANKTEFGTRSQAAHRAARAVPQCRCGSGAATIASGRPGVREATVESRAIDGRFVAALFSARFQVPISGSREAGENPARSSHCVRAVPVGA